jgi:hypothetical protein
MKTLYLAAVLLLFLAPPARGAEPDDRRPLQLTAGLEAPAAPCR